MLDRLISCGSLTHFSSSMLKYVNHSGLCSSESKCSIDFFLLLLSRDLLIYIFFFFSFISILIQWNESAQSTEYGQMSCDN